MTDTQTDRQVLTCERCGTELEQYQHFCTCGQFSQESFATDERPPECEFFEDDKACGEDSEWFVFTQQIKPMCNSHLDAMRKNYRGRIEFYPVDHEGDAYACESCGHGYGTPELAHNCCTGQTQP